MELKRSKVIFNEQEHTYFLGEKQLKGITDMISRHLFPNKYANIPKRIMEQAAQKGSLIHKEIQNWIENGESGFTDELVVFVQEFKGKYDTLYSEFLVNNNDFATAVDIVSVNGDKVGLHDIKTTYSLDEDYLSWQLSVNAYLFEHMTGVKVDSLYYIWIRGNELKKGELIRKPDSEVEALMTAELNGEKYECKDLLPQTMLQDIIRFETLIKTIEEQKKEAEAQAKTLKEKLIAEMEKNGVKSFENEKLKITYIAPNTRESIDTTKLKKELPEIAEKYKKCIATKASVRITLREQKEIANE